jgi:hypothetical protein
LAIHISLLSAEMPVIAKYLILIAVYLRRTDSVGLGGTRGHGAGAPLPTLRRP